MERAVVVAITDWTNGTVVERMPIPCEVVSILSGNYSFEPNPDFTIDGFVPVNGNELSKSHLLRHNYGRLGCSDIIPVDREIWQQALSIVEEKVSPRVLVLGTGEFSYLPFRLSEMLEYSGFDVHFQTTTRSPIIVAGDIQDKVSFGDNYEDEIDNFLYNVKPGDYDTILVGYETPPYTIQPQLISSFPAFPLFF